MMKQILISKNKKKLNLKLIHRFLENSYWAKNRTLEQVKKSINHSICYGIYENDEQIGFARVITDHITFAYLADVFILEDKRGLGYSKKLMATILSDSTLLDVKSWYLITKDAQGLYEKFDFIKYNDPEKIIMKKIR